MTVNVDTKLAYIAPTGHKPLLPHV